MVRETLASFKAKYPTADFLTEMRDRAKDNRGLMNLGASQYVGVVCLSEVEFARLLELAASPERDSRIPEKLSNFRSF